ncbi:MAG: squalene synthase HpnC [Candidatus Kapaibacterium sp.]
MIDRREEWTEEAAYAYCEKTARDHYENFPVASRLLPKRARRHVAAIYAFARYADDLADEGEMPVEERLTALDLWNQRLEEAALGNAEGPIFTALSATLRDTEIPLSLLSDLLTAFQQDARNLGYEREEDLLRYCQFSANPVGRLVLHLFGEATPEHLSLSDHICTGLQLANFWQDISVDLPRERINIPRETMRRFGYSIEELEGRVENEAFRAMMVYLSNLADEHLYSGYSLPKTISSFRLRVELQATILGGLRVVEKIRGLNYRLLNSRPVVQKGDLLKIGVRSLLRSI